MVDGGLFSSANLEYGVPQQGSITGPLLYILFKNDITDMVHLHIIVFEGPFALSTVLTQQCKSISESMASNN